MINILDNNNYEGKISMKKNVNRVLKRIFAHLFMMIAIIIALTVVYKLILKREEWLWLSVSWGIVYVIAISLKNIIINRTEDLLNKVLSGTLASACVFIIVAFVLGVIFNMSDWFKCTFDITVPFIMALALGTPLTLKKSEDEEKDIETINVLK